jgi:hypothetical protein
VIFNNFCFFKMLLQISLPLNPPILQLTNLLALKDRPFLHLILLVEVKDENRIDEVNECIPYIAMVDVVNRKVEEVKLPLMPLVDLSKQEIHVVLVRNVLDHDGCPIIFLLHNLLNVDVKHWIVLYVHLASLSLVMLRELENGRVET